MVILVSNYILATTNQTSLIETTCSAIANSKHHQLEASATEALTPLIIMTWMDIFLLSFVLKKHDRSRENGSSSALLNNVYIYIGVRLTSLLEQRHAGPYSHSDSFPHTITPTHSQLTVTRTLTLTSHPISHSLSYPLSHSL